MYKLSDNIKKDNVKSDVICSIVLVIVSIILVFFTIKRFKYFFYEETMGTLISYDNISGADESADSCIGKFEYYVNDTKYENSFSISNYYCQKGHKEKIYYDANNPKKSTNDRSIAIFLLLLGSDFLAIGGAYIMIKSIFKAGKKNLIEKNRVLINKTYNHNNYGTYEMIYDSEDSYNKYGVPGQSYISINFKEPQKIGILAEEFNLYVPNSRLNKLIEFDSLNNLLSNYRIKEKMYLENAVQVLVDQEISLMTTWYDIPNTEEGKKLAKKTEYLSIHGFTIDENMELVKIHMYYDYNDDASFWFNYDIKTKKVNNVDVHS